MPRASQSPHKQSHSKADRAGSKEHSLVQDYEEYVNTLKFARIHSEAEKQAEYKQRRNYSVVDNILPYLKSNFLQTTTQVQLR